MNALTKKGLIAVSFLYSTFSFSQQTLDPAIADIANRLDPKAFVDDVSSLAPAVGGIDRRHPSVAFPQLIKKIYNLMSRHPDLKPAHWSLKNAYSTYENGADELELNYLSQTAQFLQQAQDELSRVKSLNGDIATLQAGVNDILMEMSQLALKSLYQAGPNTREYRRATHLFSEGIRASNNFKYQEAAHDFETIITIVVAVLFFDIEQFEQNIINAMSGNAVGYSLSIAYLGNQYNGGHAEGLARTAADNPSVAQSVYKEMHVASVSKPITTIVVLNLLDELGLNPDTKVWPYFPSNWFIGPGSADLSFRDFLTHRSGADQQGMGSSYNALRSFIQNGPGANQSFSYNNGNFGMMRVLVAGLMGIDPVSYPEFASDVLTASAFIIEAQSVYDDIGVTVDCSSNDANPTIQYNFPDAGASGYEEPDNSLGCGGFGWVVSANEMTNVATHLRNTEVLLSANARDWMEDGFLGLMSPSDWSIPSGNFGTYFTHGGDWGHGPGELHACFMAFPIMVEASLFLNSERAPGLSYQCNILKNAYDAAWSM